MCVKDFIFMPNNLEENNVNEKIAFGVKTFRLNCCAKWLFDYRLWATTTKSKDSWAIK